MTQGSLQTRCPKCETRFRVTDAQLSVAGGKVRCGNCMAVFNAVEHQVATPAAGDKNPPSAPVPEAQETPANPKHPSEDDLIFADNPEEDAAEGPYAGTKLTFSDEELSDSFRTVDERGKADETEDDSQDQIDESWAEAMLSDDSPARKHSSSPKATKPPLHPDTPGPEPVEPEQTFPGVPQPREPERDEMGPEPATTPHKYTVDPLPDNEPLVAGSPYDSLRREPVAVDGNGGSRLRKTLWALVVLSLLGVLVAQVVWFQFDRLSAVPELRPFYEKACEFTGCELKPLINVEAIQSRKLVVRTNPDNRSELVVDAVIINRAAFEQPFPAIALTFSNLNGDVVAQSVFTPEEYLAGDGKNLDTMPTDTPVKILINIRDPGRDAVNYNIVFRANQP